MGIMLYRRLKSSIRRELMHHNLFSWRLTLNAINPLPERRATL